MSTKSPSISDDAVQNATGKTWHEWLAVLNDMNASELSHKEIARKLCERHEVSGWWAQTITVEYERSTGRRDIGQTGDGKYQTAVSKTLAGNIDDVLEVWQNLIGERQEFDGEAFASEPAVTKTDNWRYWRVGLADGSRINVVIGKKNDDKSQLAVNHEKLPDNDAIERWKRYWKSFLTDLLTADGSHDAGRSG